MATRYRGSVLSSTAPVTSTSSASGIWRLSDILQAIAAAVWPNLIDSLYRNNSLLLTANANNLAQNNTFLDSSTNNFTITRTGNTTQGSFSPYGANWSNYFDGSGDYMDPVSSSVSLSANWTIEFWFNTAATGGGSMLDCRPDATNGFYPNISSYSATQIGTYYNSISYFITVGTYLGAWNHVAMVKNSATLTIYFNGVSVYSVGDSNSWFIGANRPRLAANGGFFSAASDYYTGYISNLRIVNGTAVYTTAFTPSTTPLTAITNTRLLTCQSNRFIDNSTNAYAITKYGDTKVQRFSPFNLTTEYSTSTIGGSGYFDGSGDYLTAATNTAFDIGSGDFTIEGWLYFSGAPTAFTLATRGVYTSVYSFYAGNSVATPATLTWEAGTGAWGATSYSSSANALVGGQWNHIAFVRSSTSFYMYANGVRVFSQVITTISTNVTAPLWIGSYFNQGSTTNGNMADFRFVKGTAQYTGATYVIPTAPLTAVTNTSLLLNYTNAGVVDKTLQNNLETVGDAKISTTQTKFGGSSMYFDGSGDYLTIPAGQWSVFGTGQFTIEAWVYTSAYNTSGNGGEVFIDNWATTAPYTVGQWQVWITSVGVLRFEYATGTTTTAGIGTGTVSLNNWNHIAVARDGTTLTVYINGIASGSGTVSQSLGVSIAGSIARQSIGNPYSFTGYIDELRITKGVARYTTAFTVPSTGF